MKRYPLKLSYVAKTALWGGKTLNGVWGKQSPYETISETWELTVREKEMATVLCGEAAGMTLQDYFCAVGCDAVSPTYDGSHFPLLIKFIDAADTLSVQVHPDDAYASAVENDMGKTEMWYVVDCIEDAELVMGLADGFGKEEFAKAVHEGKIGDAMRRVKVHPGDCFFIPAGMLHAIGAGILIAEIQQNSDLTYRVYDFDRRQADGSLRPLHVDKALNVTRPFTDEEVNAIRFARGKEDESVLASSRYFTVQKLEIQNTYEGHVGEDSFLSLLCVEGEGILTFENEQYTICRGDSYFLPARMGEFSVQGKLCLLTSRV